MSASDLLVTPAPRLTALRARHARAARTGGPWHEAALCALGLTALAAALCAGHITRGGFTYDDWGIVALGRFPGHGGALHALWTFYGQRPGEVGYYWLVNSVLGYGAAARLGLAAALVVVESTLVFAVLRRLGVTAMHAGAIAALALLFPFSDSVWLWSSAGVAAVVISLAAAGFLVALRAFARSGRQAVALHAASLALYVASVLTYEVAAGAICLAGVLYAREVGLRKAWRRWVLDLVAVAGTLSFARLALPIDIATPSRTQSLAGMVGHAGSMVLHGGQLIGAAALPVPGVPGVVGLVLLVAVFAAAAARRGWGAGRWLGLATAGVVLALAAWAVYVPAPGHYQPTSPGTINRVNALAAIGVVLAVYAAIVLAATLVATWRRRWIVVAAATLALGGGYFARSASDARQWNAAAADQRRELAALKTLLPRPRHDATIAVRGAPLQVGSAPVLSTRFDLTMALWLAYKDPSLVGIPVTGTGCTSNTYLVDLARHRMTQCAAGA